jgi:hypothetical protein
LTDGAYLSVEAVVNFSGGIKMSPGTTFSLKNTDTVAKALAFTMSATGSNKWALIGGGATFVSPSTSASSPANISVAAGATGMVYLSTPPTITGPTTKSLAEGYAATSTDVFTLTGFPDPTVTISGDAKITWNATAKKLDIAAGLTPGSYLVLLTATNGAPPDATTSFTLTVVSSGITGVTVNPANTDVEKGKTKTFTASVAGSATDKTVSWTVSGASDAGTTISSTGVLTVAEGETATTLTVKATSTIDSSKFGTATVTVKEKGSGGGGGNTNTTLIVVVVVLLVLALLVMFFLMKKRANP